MGFLDTDVLIGSPPQQVHNIGNSVDRKVSFVLGLCLRESWAKSRVSRQEHVIETELTLASPPATDDEAMDGKSEDSQLGGGEAFPDMVRAGASAEAGLEMSEREALRTISMSAAARPTPAQQAKSTSLLHSTANESESEKNADDRLKEEGDVRVVDEKTLLDRPTAYVEVRHRQIYNN